MSEFESFENSFRDIVVGNRRQCVCGATFYNLSGDWTWEDGEIDELESDPTATLVSHAVGLVIFEGIEYVDACDCWHDRANKIIKFICSHDTQITRFLNTERQRKINDANAVEAIDL